MVASAALTSWTSSPLSIRYELLTGLMQMCRSKWQPAYLRVCQELPLTAIFAGTAGGPRRAVSQRGQGRPVCYLSSKNRYHCSSQPSQGPLAALQDATREPEAAPGVQIGHWQQRSAMLKGWRSYVRPLPRAAELHS